jgi:hypothetical protein
VSDVHLPHLEEEEETTRGKATDRWKSLLKIGLEVLLISSGVFLGLMGEQWRENVHRRELAETSLRRFRTEIQTNRKTVADVKDYHVTTKKSVDAYLASDAKAKARRDMHLMGVQPASFEHTAWDLALAMQSLAYLEPSLAFSLSRIYRVQQEYGELSRGLLQAMYVRTPTENLDGFLGALTLYYGDVTLLEPKLLNMYDEVLPQVDRALGESNQSRRSAQ